MGYANHSCRYITTGAESEQHVLSPFHQWVGCKLDAGPVCFLILGVGRLREDHYIYVETRKKRVFHNMGPLTKDYLQSVMFDLEITVHTLTGASSA